MFNLYNALVYLFECDKQYQTKTYLILSINVNRVHTPCFIQMDIVNSIIQVKLLTI